MKKYLIPSVTLLLMGSTGLFAKNNMALQMHSNIPMVGISEQTQFRAASVDVSPIRVITEEEFKGEKPVTLYLNQQLLIPVHFTINNLSFDNKLHSLNNYASNSEILNVCTGDLAISNGVATYDFNILCTALGVGKTKVTCERDGLKIIDWMINIEDPTL